jgi:hypothetical protein
MPSGLSPQPLTSGKKQGVGLLRRLKVASKLLKEEAAARWLGISKFTLQRIRKRQEISFCEVSGSVRYTIEQLEDYIRSVSKPSCQKDDFKLGSTGSPTGPAPKIGTQPTSMIAPDKQSAHLLAQGIFSKQL